MEVIPESVRNRREDLGRGGGEEDMPVEGGQVLGWGCCPGATAMDEKWRDIKTSYCTSMISPGVSITMERYREVRRNI